MLPSMRYPSTKLTDLLHDQNTYRQHRASVHQIMRKTNNEFSSRSHLLQQLKHRKSQSFNHTQLERIKEIGSNNSLLLRKLSSYQIDASNTASSEALQRKIELRHLELEITSHKHADKNYLLLKNHPRSPVNKSTLLERNRQNLRLAKMIVNPVVTYHASQFEKEHEYLQCIKERMMRFEAEPAQKKMQHYLDTLIEKKNKERRSSQASDSQNPEHFFLKPVSQRRATKDNK